MMARKQRWVWIGTGAAAVAAATVTALALGGMPPEDPEGPGALTDRP